MLVFQNLLKKVFGVAVLAMACSSGLSSKTTPSLARNILELEIWASEQPSVCYKRGAAVCAGLGVLGGLVGAVSGAANKTRIVSDLDVRRSAPDKPDLLTMGGVFGFSSGISTAALLLVIGWIKAHFAFKNGLAEKINSIIDRIGNSNEEEVTKALEACEKILQAPCKQYVNIKIQRDMTIADGVKKIRCEAQSRIDKLQKRKNDVKEMLSQEKASEKQAMIKDSLIEMLSNKKERSA